MAVVNPSPDNQEIAARRRKRAIVLGLALAAFVVLVYLLTLAKLGPAVFDRPL